MKTPILMLALVLASQAFASLINVDELNKTLQKQNAKWTAKEHRLNQMSHADAKMMMGLSSSSPEVEFVLPAARQPMDLPTSIDWRNKDGKNWVSPVLDQGNCGSCVAFASIGTLETQANISSSFFNLNLKLSPQNLFNCGGGACNFGWQPASAASYLMKHGVVDEACQPYTSGATGQDVKCSAACPDASQRLVKINNFSTPSRSARDITSVKQALQKGPLVTTMTVYADFMVYSSGVYKHTSGSAEGGHAVSIVGYDDADQAFIVRNSWGEDWGEGGFFRIAYNDSSGVGNATWAFDVPAGTGAVSILDPADHDFVGGSYDVHMASTYQNTAAIAVSAFSATGAAVWSGSCTNADCDVAFATTGLAEGRYELQAIAQDNKGQPIGTSERRYVYVTNSKPNMAITYKGNGKTDLSKPLSDRIEFAITANSTPVPMSEITFHYKGQGKEGSRDAFVVPNQLTMGWRTNLVPNGTYEIWFTGRVKSNTQDSQVESAHLTVTTKN